MIFEEKTKTQPISKEQVWAAWKRIRSHNPSGSGVDSVSISMIEKEPRKYLYPVWNRLASGSYQAPAVKEVAIPKGNRSWRLLGIPTLCDRVAQEVIRCELTSIVEPQFHKWSFAFRPHRSAHEAVKACWFNTLHYEYVVDLDIRGYFDNIDHHLMMSVLKKYTSKSYILLYCERWLKAPVLKRDGSIEATRTKGTPQGGVISPVLSNLYLHEVFDKWMSWTFHDIPFERYADDIVVHAKTLRQATYLLDQIERRLGDYKLSLHPEKTKIVRCYTSNRPYNTDKSSPVSFDFLGYNFCPMRLTRTNGQRYWGYNMRISTRGIRHIRDEVKRATRNVYQTVQELGAMLRPKILGWLHYYKKARSLYIKDLCHRINLRIIAFLMRKHQEGYRRAKRRYLHLSSCYPSLFVHWGYGMTG